MKRAQITVFFSLLLPLFLALLGACLESAYRQAQRSDIQRSLVLSEYSFLSEYQKELWERYGLFYVDTGYGEAEESAEKVEAEILDYLYLNLSWKGGEAKSAFVPFQAVVSNIDTGNYCRLTDEGGMGFYEQAVACEQDLWGASLLVSWMETGRDARELSGQERFFEESREQKYRNLEILRQRRLKEEEEDVDDPTSELWQEDDALLAAVIKNPENLSQRTVSLQGIPSRRALLQGEKTAGRFPGNPVNDQWFHTYELEKFVNAREALCQEKPAGSWLGYEMEYILMGKESDRENLRAVVNRLLLLREGANYAYLLTDESKKQEAYALAGLLVGFTLMPELVEALQQVILLGWAYGESVLDVRALLQGNKVPLLKTIDSWKLPLSQVFTLKSHLADYDGQTWEMGQGYEDYLRLLLTFAGRREKCMRGLDIMEGVIRTTERGRHLYVDQCVDGLTLQVSFQGMSLFSGILDGAGASGAGKWQAERRFAYDW